MEENNAVGIFPLDCFEHYPFVQFWVVFAVFPGISQIHLALTRGVSASFPIRTIALSAPSLSAKAVSHS